MGAVELRLRCLRQAAKQYPCRGGDTVAVPAGRGFYVLSTFCLRGYEYSYDCDYALCSVYSTFMEGTPPTTPFASLNSPTFCIRSK